MISVISSDLLFVKPKPCAYCRKDFQPYRSTQRVCATVRCSKGWAQQQRKEAERRERASTKARRDALKTLGDWTKEAQDAFNAWVRYRDISAGHGCIDCKKPFRFGALTGGGVDAGHYLSRSHAPHLRFDERNVFAQDKHCNRPGVTDPRAFRAGVVERIGEEATAALEADRSTPQYRADDLKAITADYRARLKAMKVAAQ